MNTAGSNPKAEPDEYNLYLGFMIPIGAILALCVLCLFIISWQLICPKCSKKYCPKILLDSRTRNQRTPEGTREQETAPSNGRRTSVTLLRRYSDFPPNYDTLMEQPPAYSSVVIIEEEMPPGDRSSRASGIRTYVYDPARRVSIEIHDEDTIRVVESLLSRRNSSVRRGSSLQRTSTSSFLRNSEPPIYNHVVQLPDKYPTVTDL